jgi:hypothetical protein
MDFIERIFGIAPDGGSGTFEMLLFLIPLAGLYLIYRFGTQGRRRSDDQ